MLHGTYTGNATLDSAYSVGLTIIPIILAVMVFFCLARAIKGPKIADRIVAVNMMGTLTMVIIAVLAVKMDEGYLVDICIIYAMISFLAVTLLTKVYMGVYAEHNAKANEIAAKESEEVEVGNDDSATVD
jgi:multicomponent Na+:H+ antiporter subunit F